MEKETMTNEVIETGIVDEPIDIMVEDYDDDYYESDEGSNIMGKAIKVFGGVVATVGGIVVVKKWNTIKTAATNGITNRKIKSLQKKGYHVFEPNVEVEYEDVDSSDSDKEDISEDK